MVTNKINNKGFVTEGPSDGTSNTRIEGSIVIDRYAQIPRDQAFVINRQSFTGSVHRAVKLSGSLFGASSNGQHFEEGSVWDFQNHKLLFSREHEVYTIRIDGIIPTTAVNKDVRFHIDFAVSGSIRTDGSSAHVDPFILHRQTEDVIVQPDNKIAADHIHFHAIYLVHTDADLVASGAQFYAATAGQSVEFVSGVLMIKEG